jgi:tetratricopeptide (TPR) repeat protein
MTPTVGAPPLCLVLMMLASASGDVHGQTVDAYAEALTRYSSGDFSGGVAILNQLPETAIHDAITKRWRRPVLSDAGSIRELRTAILAHTETWFVNAATEPFREYDVQFEAARSLVRTLFRATEANQSGPAVERRFVRNWYLSVAAFLQGQMKVGRARVYLAEGKRMFPRDAELLLLDGAGHEMLTDLTVATIQIYDSAGRPSSTEEVNVDKELRQAAEMLSAAVAADPGLLEARLRLGRVLYKRGDLAGAARELEAARESTKQPEIKYLATVFLGLLCAGRGELDRAASLYREAIAVVPDGQAAYIGLSEVEYLTGRVDQAAAVMSQLLARVLKDDPLWLYQSGGWWQLEARFTALREEIRR